MVFLLSNARLPVAYASRRLRPLECSLLLISKWKNKRKEMEVKNAFPKDSGAGSPAVPSRIALTQMTEKENNISKLKLFFIKHS